jgi:hypothetical protein
MPGQIPLSPESSVPASVTALLLSAWLSPARKAADTLMLGRTLPAEPLGVSTAGKTLARWLSDGHVSRAPGAVDNDGGAERRSAGTWAPAASGSDAAPPEADPATPASGPSTATGMNQVCCRSPSMLQSSTTCHRDTAE